MMTPNISSVVLQNSAHPVIFPLWENFLKSLELIVPSFSSLLFCLYVLSCIVFPCSTAFVTRCGGWFLLAHAQYRGHLFCSCTQSSPCSTHGTPLLLRPALASRLLSTDLELGIRGASLLTVSSLLTHWLFRMEHLCLWPQWGSLST